MKGMILAGETGARSYPVSIPIRKQLLPIHDKPRICYPVSVPMLAGIRGISITATPQDLPGIGSMFGDGSLWRLQSSHKERAQATSIAEAFLLGSKFIGADTVCLMLADDMSCWLYFRFTGDTRGG
jgi:glucose-1-phosphate thymidylyltransferase